mgnify:CR=1 FL=1
MREAQINLYNTDCIEGMKEFPDNYFHLAIVDPPYGIGDFASGSRNPKISKTKILDWNLKIPDKKYFKELFRVSKNQIIWGANYYPDLIGGRIVWYKHVKAPNMSKCEIAYTSKHKKVEYIDLIWQNINRKETIIHPCQKPVSLYIWLLEKYTKSNNERILDTHLGSGSIVIAADKLGFDLWGYELDKDYYEGAVNRLTEHRKQLRLF